MNVVYCYSVTKSPPCCSLPHDSAEMVPVVTLSRPTVRFSVYCLPLLKVNSLSDLNVYTFPLLSVISTFRVWLKV